MTKYVLQLYINGYILWFSYAFKVCSKSVSEIRYIPPVIVVGGVMTHKIFDAGKKYLSTTDGHLKRFPRSMWVRKSNLQIPLMCTHFSDYVEPPKCIVDTADIQKTLFGQVKVCKLRFATQRLTNQSPNTIAWSAMTSCKEYPFSIHIEILLMMTQINKVFTTTVREIEDLIPNRKVFFKVIEKDCLVFINKNCIVVVIIRDENKENCVEYFHHRQ